ncbi:hypothetical protein [Ancylobacter mangrovi]|uniref:Uncharacterized protein n=1 Tax=Ancylobacter mangrovi TaxID=2972472 RepID=A0A9X2PFX4_9HYPH|nr:hypothetical protein [Ancylobacter mangrovi]MCS0496639.1 hypothetical protein [Ancylobacter mangrovi]MCS0505279.1 hypothetical protein [Ancylobacter mangrovi]
MTANHSRLSFLARAGAAAAPAALLFAGLSFTAPAPADAAVVYCTGPGYPRGCVVRPTPARTTARVIYCTRPGYPVGCVAGGPARAQTRALARPGPGVNLNGGVNGPGLR